MKKSIILLFLFCCLPSYSQEDAWVYFNSKSNADFYFNNPLQMLSQRALNRRILQNIELDLKDVPITQSFINQIANSNGITVMARSKWLNAVHIRGSVANINALTAFSFVNNVSFANKLLNTVASGKIIVQSRNQKINKSLEVAAIYNYGTSSNQIQMLNGHLLHQQNFTGSGKIIAVLDSGFQGVNTVQPFDRLRTNNLILGGYNFVSRNNNLYSADSHGTLVLSTMGGYTENQLIGTAPDASYYLYVTEDVLSENPVEESLWVEAAETADSLGVDIINSSLGYFAYDNPNYSYTYSDMNGTTSFISRGANVAFSRGMIVVVSAGNSGLSSNPHIGSPADAIKALTVGAVNATEQYVGFSSIGLSFDGRIKPDIMALGQNATVSNMSGNIIGASGTSFSSPISCGLIACLWQAFPNKTNQQIVDMIKASSDRFLNPNVQYGYGIPDFNLALTNTLATFNDFNAVYSLFPNPTSDILKITFSQTIKQAHFKLYNALGQIVLEKEMNNPTIISLEKLSNGVYFYNIQGDFSSQTGKIIKK